MKTLLLSVLMLVLFGCKEQPNYEAVESSYAVYGLHTYIYIDTATAEYVPLLPDTIPTYIFGVGAGEWDAEFTFYSDDTFSVLRFFGGGGNPPDFDVRIYPTIYKP